MAVDYLEVLFDVDYVSSCDVECVSLSSSGSKPVDSWELLVGSLESQDAGESGLDYGIGSSSSCCITG